MNCSVCSGELTRTTANTQYDVLMCLDWRCRMHNQPQHYIRCGEPLGPGEGPKKPKAKQSRRSYLHYLGARKENYQALRKQGVKSAKASLCSSHKARARLEEELKKRKDRRTKQLLKGARHG